MTDDISPLHEEVLKLEDPSRATSDLLISSSRSRLLHPVPLGYAVAPSLPQAPDPH
jgi:hypothetical protein